MQEGGVCATLYSADAALQRGEPDVAFELLAQATEVVQLDRRYSVTFLGASSVRDLAWRQSKGLLVPAQLSAPASASASASAAAPVAVSTQPAQATQVASPTTTPTEPWFALWRRLRTVGVPQHEEQRRQLLQHTQAHARDIISFSPVLAHVPAIVAWMCDFCNGELGRCAAASSSFNSDYATVLKCTVASITCPLHPLWLHLAHIGKGPLLQLLDFDTEHELQKWVFAAWCECYAQLDARERIENSAAITERWNFMQHLSQEQDCNKLLERAIRLNAMLDSCISSEPLVARMGRLQVSAVPLAMAQPVFEAWYEHEIKQMEEMVALEALSPVKRDSQDPVYACWRQFALPERCRHMLTLAPDADDWIARAKVAADGILSRDEQLHLKHVLELQFNPESLVLHGARGSSMLLAYSDLFQILVHPIDACASPIVYTTEELQWIVHARMTPEQERLLHTRASVASNLQAWSCLCMAPPSLRVDLLQRLRIRQRAWETYCLVPSMEMALASASSVTLAPPELSKQASAPGMVRRRSSRQLVEEAAQAASEAAQQGDVAGVVREFQEVLTAVVADMENVPTTEECVRMAYQDDPQRVKELRDMTVKLRNPRLAHVRQYMEALCFALNELYMASVVQTSGKFTVRSSGVVGFVDTIPEPLVRTSLQVATAGVRAFTHVSECKRAVEITMLASGPVQFEALAREIALRVASHDETILRLNAIYERELQSSALVKSVRAAILLFRRTRVDTKMRETAKEDVGDLMEALRDGELAYDLDALRASETPLIVAQLMARLLIEKVREAESRRQREKMFRLVGRGAERITRIKTPLGRMDDWVQGMF